MKTNVARFTSMLQGQRDLVTVADMLLGDLVPLVQAQQGALLVRAAKGELKSRDSLLQMASRSLAEGDMQVEVSFASAALSIPAQAAASRPADTPSLRPHEILYWALLWLGRNDEAKAHFEICREADPANPLYLDHARLFDQDLI